MDKHEILEKSRREPLDEGVEFAEAKGRKFGHYAMILSMLILMILCKWQELDYSTLYILFGVYGFVEGMGTYHVSRKPLHLVGAGAGLYFFAKGFLTLISQFL